MLMCEFMHLEGLGLECFVGVLLSIAYCKLSRVGVEPNMHSVLKVDR